MSEKIKEMELADKIKHTGEKTFDIVKSTSHIVAEKANEVYVYN